MTVLEAQLDVFLGQREVLREPDDAEEEHEVDHEPVHGDEEITTIGGAAVRAHHEVGGELATHSLLLTDR